MAIGKWAMRLSGLLFLVIGLGALAVALFPSITENFVDNATGDSSFGIGATTADTVRLTAWILAATFIPGAFLFFWVGQWFKSGPSFTSMMQTAQMAQANSAFPQAYPQGFTPPGTAAPGTGIPSTPMPVVEPPPYVDG
jgi:hypothetical protein